MLLWHEQRVEVPEASLDETVGWHLLKAHLEEDLSELVAHLVQWVERTSVLIGTKGLEVVWLESSGLPCARGEHVGRKIGLLLDHLEAELWTLGDLEADDLLHLDELALLEVGKNLRVWVCLRLGNSLQLLLGIILDAIGLSRIS